MIAWTEFTAQEAVSARGWLKAICPGPPDPLVQYTHDTLPVWDEDLNAWREQSTLGSYLDYGPEHHRSAEYRLAAPGNIHCVVYNPRGVHYAETVADAKAWIEQQAREIRPELAQVFNV